MVVAVVAWTGCGETPVTVPPRRPPARPQPVDSFYATVAGAAIDGAAARVVANPEAERVTTLLSLDFEDGTLQGLSPLQEDGRSKRGTNKDRPPKNPGKKLKSVSRVVGLGNAAHVLHIGGGVSGPASFRSEAIPIDPGTSYTVSYRVRTRDLKGRNGSRYRFGTVEALFYGVPDHYHDATRHLRSAANRKRCRKRSKQPAAGPNETGTVDWVTHSFHFTAPDKANRVVLSIDHSRGMSDRGVGFTTSGEVWFDDIRLVARGPSVGTKYANPDDLDASSSPLQLRVELPAEDHGAETRYALYAPAPSVLRFTRTIPPSAFLSLATGVVREGWVRERGDVRFTVTVVDAGGERHRVLEATHDPGGTLEDRYWHAHLVDLGDFAGQKVTIELETSADPAFQDDYPGAAAVWGDPVLFSRDGQGRLVVMVVIDAVSLSHLSAYGYERRTTPHLERIGAQGVVFEQAYTAAPWTLPSFASFFTGIDPVHHGAGERAWRELIWRRPLPERFVTLAEALRAAGFQTMALMNNPYLTSAFGLGQGFTTYRDYGVGTRTGSGKVGVDRAIDWLETHRGYDRFLVVHLMDCHGPYRPPRSYATRFVSGDYEGRFEKGMNGKDYLDLAQGDAPARDELEKQQVRDLYDGALLYADTMMGRLYDYVEANAGTADVTFIVTSDHGEELWEHGGYEHGHQAYQELIRVPLVMINPAAFDGGRRIAAPVRLNDLVPTILDLAGVEPLTGIQGISLRPLLENKPAGWPMDREIHAENELYGSAQAALVKGNLKYLYNMANSSPQERRPRSKARHELYDLSADPGETHSIAQTRPQELRELHRLMDSHLRTMLAGRYVLVLDGGGQTRRFKGSLALPGQRRWFVYYEDIIAPLPDGSQGAFKVANRRDKLEFDVTTPRAVLAFRTDGTLRAGEGAVTLELDVDGEPWRGGVRTPRGGVAGNGELTITCDDSVLVAAPEALPDPGDDGVAVFLARTSERSLGAGQNKVLSDDTVERLRALGYMK